MNHAKRFFNKIFITLLSACLFLSFCGFSYSRNLNTQFTEADYEIPSSFTAENFYRMHAHRLIRYYCKRVEAAYRHLIRITRRDNFKGYCAMYVNNLLVYYGINSEYVKGDANVLYSKYSSKSYTDNGYFIEAISAKDYTLREALLLYTQAGSPSENILVIFSKGATEKGKEFGHVFYVNCIIGNTVVFSESAPSVFETVTVPEGAPLVCSIDEVCEKYANYKFEGLIHFTSLSEPPAYIEYWHEKNCKYTFLRSAAFHVCALRQY